MTRDGQERATGEHVAQRRAPQRQLVDHPAPAVGLERDVFVEVGADEPRAVDMARAQLGVQGPEERGERPARREADERTRVPGNDLTQLAEQQRHCVLCSIEDSDFRNGVCLHRHTTLPPGPTQDKA